MLRCRSSTPLLSRRGGRRTMGWKLAQIRCEGLSVFDGGKWWGRKPRNCRGTYHMLREVLGGPGKKRPRSTRHLLVSFNNVKMRAPVPHLHTHCITSHPYRCPQAAPPCLGPVPLPGNSPCFCVRVNNCLPLPGFWFFSAVASRCCCRFA